MEKRKANTDVTYCTNKKCKFKNICERNIEHYDFNSKLLYWFGEFDELECEKCNSYTFEKIRYGKSIYKEFHKLEKGE